MIRYQLDSGVDSFNTHHCSLFYNLTVTRAPASEPIQICPMIVSLGACSVAMMAFIATGVLVWSSSTSAVHRNSDKQFG